MQPITQGLQHLTPVLLNFHSSQTSKPRESTKRKNRKESENEAKVDAVTENIPLAGAIDCRVGRKTYSKPFQ